MDLTWLIGGKTGEGIDSAGELLALAAAKAGYEVRTFRLFPSVIKGGHTTYEVRISDRPRLARSDAVDLAVAFDVETLAGQFFALAPGALVLYDASVQSPADAPPANALALPFAAIAQGVGDRIVKNSVALGASAWLLGLDRDCLEAAVARRFGEKKAALVEQNVAALRAGWEQARARLPAPIARLGRRAAPPRLLLSGNEAIAFGALAAGCRIYASYPITPATDILEWLALRLPEVGGAVVQTEDEIAALGVVIGAQYAGVRALTATSGPGISLMTEAFGLSGMSETPCVIVDQQRPGPSAGQPTKHEQSDLQHLLYAGHGEIPRIVLAPGTAEECFVDVQRAFNLADRYQCPVFVAGDQDLALARRSLPPFDLEAVPIDRGPVLDAAQLAALPDGPYRRFADTPSGVSPRVLPGTPIRPFVTSGDEHDESGQIDVEDPAVRTRMVAKRLRKLRAVLDEVEGVQVHGEPQAPLWLVAAGSTVGPALEAIERLAARGAPAALLQLRLLWPFPAAAVARALEPARRVLVVECNATGQLARLLRSELPLHERIESVLKWDGFPWRPGELLARVEPALATWPSPPAGRWAREEAEG